ncbi:hypothetical protein CSHISOI_10045, partial [Colletotrichum shisoi]
MMYHLLYKTIARAAIPPLPILSPDADLSDDADNHSIGAVIVASVVPTTIVSTPFAFARLFVKGWIQRRVQYDDGLLLLAVASGWTATGTTLKAVALGNGKHVATLTDEQKEEALRWTVVTFAFGIVALALPKLTIVALINRILNPKRLHRFFLWALVLLCAVGLLGNVVGLFAQCPQEAVVQITLTKTACLGPERAVAYSISTSGELGHWSLSPTKPTSRLLTTSPTTAISAATNGYLAVYVAFSVRRLKITRRKRVALAISLVLGLLALFTALLKCTRLKSLGSPDFTYDSADLVIWTSNLAGSPAFAEVDSLSTQVPEMIIVEKEFEIAYSRTMVTRPCTSDSWTAVVPPEERLQIVKNQAPDGSMTTTVVVK